MPQIDGLNLILGFNSILGLNSFFFIGSILNPAFFYLYSFALTKKTYFNGFALLKLNTAKVMLIGVISQDYPIKNSFGFQDPATGVMGNIIALHADILFFEICIFILIFTFYLFILYESSPDYSSFLIPENVYENIQPKQVSDVTHATLLEIVWTTFPALLLVIISVPSILLLFRADMITSTVLTVKVIGNQWYWCFEYQEVSKQL